jgi:ribA/ribD-fused uncharacterized protein
MSTTSNKYTFFYGHHASTPLSALSQHHATGFSEGAVRFATAEHYMMYRKALLFDPPAAAAILSAASPQDAKRLGRAVANFDSHTWDAACDGIVERGSFLKFTQNPEAHAQLASTEGLLVEAAPRDRIWGIGFGEKDAMRNQDRWGQNRCV